ncbi:tyrosine-protein phosphatase [Ferrimicrobium sp.]|uniref:tyrosine-protein phosphatase n=1 Tax=Ferrimicrobium sp. TaxID=2926050 RepID=UPI002635DEBE|nr:tyrosine-protein phosphatase [Ferrimicrobium sp.]
MTGERALRVDGLVNARDLGGLRRHNGSYTPRGVFFRSENLDRVSEAGWDQIWEAGIRTVVDLRQPSERSCDVGSRPGWLTIRQVDLDGLDNEDFWSNYWDNGLKGTALYFLPHLQAMPERTGAALSAILNAPPGGVLFHCMSGRDRTGMIAMLLLRAVDADTEDIVDDYLETVRLGELRAASENQENDENAREEPCRSHGTTTENAFRSALSQLQLPTVLTLAGLSEPDLQALRSWRNTIQH